MTALFDAACGEKVGGKERRTGAGAVTLDLRRGYEAPFLERPGRPLWQGSKREEAKREGEVGNGRGNLFARCL